MGRDDLYITVPSLFRCPISLDVMKSPVSLSTGVTYDRSSIQRWLDAGNNTCPATMQVLESKDFVPNHTLHRLIQIWAASARARPEPELHSLSSAQAQNLINYLLKTAPLEGKFECFVKLLCFASENKENQQFLASNDAFLDHLFGLVSDPKTDPDVLETGLKILQVVSPKRTVVGVLKAHPGFLSAAARIMKTGRPDSRAAVAGILEAIAADPESKKAVFDNEELLSELLGALSNTAEAKEGLVESILCALISLSSPRRNKVLLVRAGGVRVVTELMAMDNATINSVHNTTSANTNTNNNSNAPMVTVTELSLTLLEMLAGSAEGRGAITENPNCIPRIVQKMMKVSSSANEHAVALLWSLCYLFRDQKAREAVMRSNGGLTKILLLMQSNCSPAVKRMCCDLLRIFRVNSKSCLSSYDTKTTHIMPC